MRLDQHVGHVIPLEALEELTAYLSGFMGETSGTCDPDEEVFSQISPNATRNQHPLDAYRL